MKDDILRFRKLCDSLIKDRDYTVNKISIESGIMWPTMKKLLEEQVSDIKITASILGRVQDFIHKHCNDILYAGIKSDCPPEILPEKIEEEPRIKAKSGVIERRKKEGKIPKIKSTITDEEWKEFLNTPEGKDKLENAIKLSKHPFFTGFWKFIDDASKVVPEGIQITITINSTMK